MYKYNVLRQKRTYDELVDYIIRRHQQQINYHSRGVLSEMYDESAIMVNASTLHEKEDKVTQTELRTIEKSMQTDIMKMIEKATQTDVFHKGAQVNVKLNPNEYQHWLKAYDGEEVINYRYLFN